ncbi:glutathione S-transferase family protein [uncultured Paraglaciecola sp.]|uniref:glutathione S-transferase family protein n=1 Tax=uncultured Paraglaciecola sp. TaxID=1765024 RepID=UPI0025F64E1C|nr:glutathione S-transferase family protein [uncultured Paraglaciecola sp.]
MKLYSAWYCPFAQRTWMSLLQKGVKFEYIETDPYDKTEQWLNTSRQTGTVPVLAPEKGNTIPGSTRTIEYLELASPNTPRLYSIDPEEKAEQSFWIDFVSEHITPYFYRFLKSQKNDDFQYESTNKLVEGLSVITQAMSNQGPYFNGNDISAVDITLFPFAYRIKLLLGFYKSFELPQQGPTWQRLNRWYTEMLTSSSFQKTIGNAKDYDQRLIQFYLPYSLGGGQANVTALAT